MRVAVPHTLGKDEVRRRLKARMGEAPDKARESLGALASIAMHWDSDDRLTMDVSAMGFAIPCTLDIEDAALVFEVEIPAGLGFARSMIEGTIREKGAKLLG